MNLGNKVYIIKENSTQTFRNVTNIIIIPNEGMPVLTIVSDIHKQYLTLNLKTIVSFLTNQEFGKSENFTE